MLKPLQILGALFSLGLLLGGSEAALGQGMIQPQSAPAHSMGSADAMPAAGEFRRIEQPLAVHLTVTAAGLALLGLELWWFLGRKPGSKSTSS